MSRSFTCECSAAHPIQASRIPAWYRQYCSWRSQYGSVYGHYSSWYRHYWAGVPLQLISHAGGFSAVCLKGVGDVSGTACLPGRCPRDMGPDCHHARRQLSLCRLCTQAEMLVGVDEGGDDKRASTQRHKQHRRRCATTLAPTPDQETTCALLRVPERCFR